MPAVQGVTTARAGWSAVTDLVPAAIPAVAYNAKLLQPRGIKRVDGQSHVGVVDIARRDELDRGPWLGDEAIDQDRGGAADDQRRAASQLQPGDPLKARRNRLGLSRRNDDLRLAMTVRQCAEHDRQRQGPKGTRHHYPPK